MSASSAARIFISRSKVKRPRPASRDACKISGGKPGHLAGLRRAESAVVQHRDDSSRQNRLGVLQVRVRITKIPEDVPASHFEVKVPFVHCNKSLFNRASRAFTKSRSAFGVLIPVVDFLRNACTAHILPANSVT